MEPMTFIPTQDFFSEPFDSYYCQGLQYTAHPDNARLREAVAQWVAAGKVRLGSDPGGQAVARMGGIGTVS